MTTSDHQLPTTINEKLLPETSLHDTGQYFIDEYNWNFGHFAAFCDQLFGTRVTRKILEGLWCSHLKRICESDEDKQRRDQASSLLPVCVFPISINGTYWYIDAQCEKFLLEAWVIYSIPTKGGDERINLSYPPLMGF